MIKNKLQKSSMLEMITLGIILKNKNIRDAFERLTWSKNQMQEFKFAKFKEIFDYSFYNSPFYNNLYTKNNLSPDKIKNIKDIEKVPILTKKMLKQAIIKKSIFSTKKIKGKITKSTTTGSSGNPLTLYFDKQGQDNRFANVTRAFWMMGALPYKKTALIWRKKELTIKEKIRKKLGLFKYFSVMDINNIEQSTLGKKQIKNLLHELEKFNPEIIRGYTSSLWLISRLSRKYNLNIKPKHIINSAEYLPPIWQNEIEKVFQCPVHNLYGGTEAAPIGTSLSNNKNIVVFEDFYFTEIINKDNILQDSNKVGRIIITDYNNLYMPLIRYEIGDVAEWSDQSIGPFKSFKEVKGRINDIFILPNNKILFSHNWHIYFRDMLSVSKFQVIQKEIDKIEVYLEYTETENWKQEIDKTKQIVQNSLGKNIYIKWHLVDNIKLEPGEKFRSVKSLLDINSIIKKL